MKLECLAIMWATAKLCPYLMANKFDAYTDHYALQWLKSMRTRSALLHRWFAAFDEFLYDPPSARQSPDPYRWAEPVAHDTSLS